MMAEKLTKSQRDALRLIMENDGNISLGRFFGGEFKVEPIGEARIRIDTFWKLRDAGLLTLVHRAQFYQRYIISDAGRAVVEDDAS